jgi:hypothetical protein
MNRHCIRPLFVAFCCCGNGVWPGRRTLALLLRLQHRFNEILVTGIGRDWRKASMRQNHDHRFGFGLPLRHLALETAQCNLSSKVAASGSRI